MLTVIMSAVAVPNLDLETVPTMIEPSPRTLIRPSHALMGVRSALMGLVRNSDQLTGMCLGIVRKTWFLNLKYGCSGG
jgi:hypothetical protein